MPQLMKPRQPDLNQTNQLLSAILERVGGGQPQENFGRMPSEMQLPQMPQQQVSQMQPQPQAQPQPQMPTPQASQQQGRGFAPNFFSKLGQGEHRTPFGNFLAQMGVPLAATAVGLSSERMLPGAAGAVTGFNVGTQQAFENKLKKQEQDRKNELYSSGKGVYQVDPITGELKEIGNVPYRSVVQKGVLSPGQMKERAVAEGEAKGTVENIKSSKKIAASVQKLAVLQRQFKEAFPSGDRTPLEQRIAGNIEALRVKYGFSDNSKLLALRKNIRPMAVQIIKGIGEVGALSETDINTAIDTVDQTNITDEERIAQVRQFAEFALAGADPEALNILKKNKNIRGILDAFSINLDSLSDNDNSVPIVGGEFNGERVRSVTRIE